MRSDRNDVEVLMHLQLVGLVSLKYALARIAPAFIRVAIRSFKDITEGTQHLSCRESIPSLAIQGVVFHRGTGRSSWTAPYRMKI